MRRLGAVLDRVDERIPGSNLPLLSVSQTRGVIRRTEISDKPARAETLDVYKVCRAGDLVFNKMSVRAGAVGVAQEDGLVTYHYEVMRPHDADPRYLVHLMKSEWFIGELIRRERGIGAGDQSASVRTTEVPFRILRAIKAPIPDLEGQGTIADILDIETAQIDTLIARQEQLITILRERRSAEISAATEEVGPLVPLRRIVGRIRQGASPNCEKVPGDGVTEWAVLKTGCSNSGRFDPTENKRLPDDEAPNPEHAVNSGDIVLSRSNTGALVGMAAVVKGFYPRLLLSDLNYAITLHGETDPEFVAYAMRSGQSRAVLTASAKGTSSSMQKLSQRDVLNLEIALPSRESQHRIVQQLDAKVSAIDTLITKAERFIELSKERRSALITAAVTGQVDMTTDRVV